MPNWTSAMPQRWRRRWRPSARMPWSARRRFGASRPASGSQQFTARDVVPAGTCSKPPLAPPPPPPLHSSPPSRPACPFRSAPYRSMAAASSPPRSSRPASSSAFACSFSLAAPKLNGRVERANRTHIEEFHEITPRDWCLPALNRDLRAWEHTYNAARPHRALSYRSPPEFLQQLQPAAPAKGPSCNTSTGRVHLLVQAGRGV